MNSEWINYGDVNFMEHDGLFVKSDAGRQGCFYILEVVAPAGHESSYDEDLRWINEGYIDLSDSWIEWEGVKETMDLQDDAEDSFKASEVWRYYGYYNCGGSQEAMNVLEAESYLAKQGIKEGDFA